MENIIDYILANLQKLGTVTVLILWTVTNLYYNNKFYSKVENSLIEINKDIQLSEKSLNKIFDLYNNLVMKIIDKINVNINLKND